MPERSVTRECDCPVPRDHREFSPGFRDGYCRHCGGWINPAWLSTDETFDEFFDHLARIPGVTPAFIQHCRQRELAGRPVFGHEFLARNNDIEASEEVADFANYMLFRCLRKRREGKPSNRAKALRAAHHAALAHQLALELAAEQ
jgi:hypothetical protein